MSQPCKIPSRSSTIARSERLDQREHFHRSIFAQDLQRRADGARTFRPNRRLARQLECDPRRALSAPQPETHADYLYLRTGHHGLPTVPQSRRSRLSRPVTSGILKLTDATEHRAQRTKHGEPFQPTCRRQSLNVLRCLATSCVCGAAGSTSRWTRLRGCTTSSVSLHGRRSSSRTQRIHSTHSCWSRSTPGCARTSGATTSSVQWAGGNEIENIVIGISDTVPNSTHCLDGFVHMFQDFLHNITYEEESSVPYAE
ncbi:hypothetical protein AcV5_006747 [Taiwanofungus camphoratus]|nr:hypothetical protein AcV5_006747 [Antrodia cinnamomea]